MSKSKSWGISLDRLAAYRTISLDASDAAAFLGLPTTAVLYARRCAVRRSDLPTTARTDEWRGARLIGSLCAEGKRCVLQVECEAIFYVRLQPIWPWHESGPDDEFIAIHVVMSDDEWLNLGLFAESWVKRTSAWACARDAVLRRARALGRLREQALRVANELNR